MYVAARDMTLQQSGYGSVAEGLRELDLDAVELAVSRDLSVLAPEQGLGGPRGRVDPAELTARYRDANIRICGLLVANNFNAADIRGETEWVVGAVRIAHQLGVGAVRIDSAMTGQQELPLKRRVAMYASAVCRVLETTGDLGVCLAIENHGVQGNDPAWMQGVLDAVASERLGLTLDTGNFYWAGHPLQRVYEAIRQFAPHVKHAHCKNIAFPPEQREQCRQAGWGYGQYVCPIPDGDVDHGQVVAILHEAGYRGGMTIEDESLAKFEGPERRRQLRRDADHLAAAVESVGGRRHAAGG